MSIFRRNRIPSGVDPSRVPPGQTLATAGKWPVLQFGPVPKADLGSWNLKVFGAVENQLLIDHAQLMQMPVKDVTADIHCVTGWSRLGDTWTGVPIQHVLEAAKPAVEATHVMAHCEYGYTTSVPIGVLNDDDVLLCYRWNGTDLTPEHGWPLRLLIPKKYLWKSAKWLRGLEFLDRNRLGFWEQRGYHDEADPWKEQRYW